MSPAFFRLADCFSEPILLVSREGTIRAVNRAAAKDLERSERELVGQSLTALGHRSVENVQSFLRACLRSRDPLPGAVRLGVGDGMRDYRAFGCGFRLDERSETLCVLRLLPKQTAGTQFVSLNDKITALNREISRRRQVESSLLEQREWFQVTLRSIGDAVIATDHTGQVTLLNKTAEALTGWPETEARGRPLPEIFRIINEYSRQPVENPVDKVIEKGKIVGLANHTVLIDRAGRERPIEDSAAPIYDAGGTLLGVVLVFHDITSRRVVEKELEQSQNKLQERVSDLEKFHDVVVGRELKMMELETEIKRLKRELERYRQSDPPSQDRPT